MIGKSWYEGRLVWMHKPGAPPPHGDHTGRTHRRATAVISVLSLVAVLALGCSSGGGAESSSAGGAGASKEPLKIGAVVSLTGSYAGLGQPEKNVLDMEVERINAAGGVNGHPLEVEVIDDATDPGKAASAVSKLVEGDVLAVLGATGTGQTMAMRPEIERSQIPQVSMAGGTVITQQFSEWVFQTPWSNSIVVPFTLEHMKGKGIAKVALLSESGGFGKDGVAVIKASAPKAGITVVADETFNPGDADMTSQLTKIRGTKPDAIMVVSAGKEAATIVKNAKQLGLTVPLYGTHGNARAEFVTAAGDAAEGFTFAAGKVLLPEEYGKDTPAYNVASGFVERYTKEYGAAPSTFAGHAYDALYLTVEAMKRLPEGFTAKQLRDEIEKTSGFVGIGGTFTFSPTDHNGMTEKDLVVYEVRGGGWTIAK